MADGSQYNPGVSALHRQCARPHMCQLCVCVHLSRARPAEQHHAVSSFIPAIMWLKHTLNLAQSMATRVPAAICKTHDTAHHVTSGVWATPLGSADNFHWHRLPFFIIQKWLPFFLSFFNVYFLCKRQIAYYQWPDCQQPTTEHSRLSVPKLFLLQILLHCTWNKSTLK